jgi:8-oxo-dGTP pyrophosphatase MutT (NUDIX family)
MRASVAANWTDEPVPEWLAGLVTAAQALPPEVVPESMRLPAGGSAREAAVLMAFCETASGPSVLLTERARNLRTHAGQVAFPGGAVEPEDSGPVAAALREASEEVGLDSSTVQVVATMARRFLPPSGFLVTPVIAWWRTPHPIAALSAGEVDRAAVVAIADLADPANRFQVRSPRLDLLGPAFETDGLFIWGFTAALLAGLLILGGWERAWDGTDVRPLPPGRLR